MSIGAPRHHGLHAPATSCADYARSAPSLHQLCRLGFAEHATIRQLTGHALHRDQRSSLRYRYPAGATPASCATTAASASETTPETTQTDDLPAASKAHGVAHMPRPTASDRRRGACRGHIEKHIRHHNGPASWPGDEPRRTTVNAAPSTGKGP